MNRAVIVLAAGKGTRMKSPRAKVLHPVLGRPMLARLLEGLRALSGMRYGPRALRVVRRAADIHVREPFG